MCVEGGVSLLLCDVVGALIVCVCVCVEGDVSSLFCDVAVALIVYLCGRGC